MLVSGMVRSKSAWFRSHFAIFLGGRGGKGVVFRDGLMGGLEETARVVIGINVVRS